MILKYMKKKPNSTNVKNTVDIDGSVSTKNFTDEEIKKAKKSKTLYSIPEYMTLSEMNKTPDTPFQFMRKLRKPFGDKDAICLLCVQDLITNSTIILNEETDKAHRRSKRRKGNDSNAIVELDDDKDDEDTDTKLNYFSCLKKISHAGNAQKHIDSMHRSKKVGSDIR